MRLQIMCKDLFSLSHIIDGMERSFLRIGHNIQRSINAIFGLIGSLGQEYQSTELTKTIPLKYKEKGNNRYVKTIPNHLF